MVARIHPVLGPPDRPVGRPPALSLYRSVLLTLVLMRQNPAQTVAADWFGVSQPTVSRIVRRIAPLIGQVTCLHTPPLPDALAGRVVLVDGALVPTDDHASHRKANHNTKHRQAGVTVQVPAALDGTLPAVTGPVEGRTHDSNAYTLTGLDVLLCDTQVVGDLGYQGTPAIRPRRKRPGHTRHTPADKTWNTSISRIRWAVEHAIAHPKDRKILATGYRPRLTELPTLIRIVTSLEYYRQGW
ncbi:transposase family protein [Saccharothrix yanglingensis]|uniref:transposase family protein n=1 Tax=Saccharothrix yanglingensis TaxID=659496 RepID=UPI0027D30643|nr:transposase family protein [Saccharothrix yanglingensis]